MPTISAEAYVLEHVVPYVAERWNARPPQLALLGVSMGGQGALRMAYKYPNVFPTVAAISPAIDFQKRIDEGVDPGLDFMYRDAEDARQDTAMLHIHPLNWPRNQFFCCDPTDIRWHDSADRLRMKLWSLGVPFECDLETEAGGHSFEYACHMAQRAVGFIAQRLDQERRTGCIADPYSGRFDPGRQFGTEPESARLFHRHPAAAARFADRSGVISKY